RGIRTVATFPPGARGNFDLPPRCALRVLPLQRPRPTMKLVRGPPPPAVGSTGGRAALDARSRWNEATNEHAAHGYRASEPRAAAAPPARTLPGRRAGRFAIQSTLRSGPRKAIQLVGQA